MTETTKKVRFEFYRLTLAVNTEYRSFEQYLDRYINFKFDIPYISQKKRWLDLHQLKDHRTSITGTIRKGELDPNLYRGKPRIPEEPIEFESGEGVIQKSYFGIRQSSEHTDVIIQQVSGGPSLRQVRKLFSHIVKQVEKEDVYIELHPILRHDIHNILSSKDTRFINLRVKVFRNQIQDRSMFERSLPLLEVIRRFSTDHAPDYIDLSFGLAKETIMDFERELKNITGTDCYIMKSILNQKENRLVVDVVYDKVPQVIDLLKGHLFKDEEILITDDQFDDDDIRERIVSLLFSSSRKGDQHEENFGIHS
ncbi:hypothetical protein [Pseudobacteriovorax antillogorgiicola]|nr:hypothetical protein [Pseudobacteriovorax antillogorgiicola]